MTSWVDACTKILRRGVTIYAYFNNRYAGFGPASVQRPAISVPRMAACPESKDQYHSASHNAFRE
jgi:hypothetical protein